MSDNESWDIASVAEDVVEVAARNTDVMYLTFDIDSDDPRFAPRTGVPIYTARRPEQAYRVTAIVGGYDDVGAVHVMAVVPRVDSNEVLSVSRRIYL